MPPIVSFGLTPDQHFDAAPLASQKRSPLEKPISLDEDLTFAAYVMCTSRDRLDTMGSQAIDVVRKLKARWKSVTSRIRQHQCVAVRQVTKARDIGLLALLRWLLAWPDVTMGNDLRQGYPAVGHCMRNGVFTRQGVPLSEKKAVYENIEA